MSYVKCTVREITHVLLFIVPWHSMRANNLCNANDRTKTIKMLIYLIQHEINVFPDQVRYFIYRSLFNNLNT